MDVGWLEYLKGTSPLATFVIVAITYLLIRKLREDQKGDVDDRVRANLGLAKEERFDDKLDRAIAKGFGDSVHPLTLAIASLTQAVGELRAEVKGLREGLTNHGERITKLETQVAMLEKEKESAS